jgi:hypothetical protein
LFQLDTGPGLGGDEQKTVKKMREFLEVNTTGGGHFLDDLGLRVVLYIVHANALTSRGFFFFCVVDSGKDLRRAGSGRRPEQTHRVAVQMKAK